ncbi:MAG: class I SAM-dependent methyltransferase [Thermodesulfobacteriota bacterium]
MTRHIKTDLDVLGNETRAAASEPAAFPFGANWRRFLESFDEERLSRAKDSLTEFLRVDDLEGKSFVDIGCGSGLFSYAAHELGAAQVLSFDVDRACVECCTRLRARAGNPDTWEIREGSILDEAFVFGLGRFDLVYSWGVLHHTGRMWDAIEKAATLVKPQGLFYIALYNRLLDRQGDTSLIHGFWTSVKRIYNAHPWFGRLGMEPLAMAAYLFLTAARGQNPIRHVRSYKSDRGMDWHTDARDWLGGYPYEFATRDEVVSFVTSRFPDMVLVNLKPTTGRGLNWFLLRNGEPAEM